ncbi:hypothetical protein TRM7615_05050 [Falsiruegeria mediterranea M17]|uniref:Uncharacterized protein n=1 Tax=Falsiruegeria mediterranea M17 TaxID=1200281 RepID=A0A2R8CGH8_9RHOB|nr:hypothetical protein TRM7615_05050 [Falsiruegeria mediterranea M17]
MHSRVFSPPVEGIIRHQKFAVLEDLCVKPTLFAGLIRIDAGGVQNAGLVGVIDHQIDVTIGKVLQGGHTIIRAHEQDRIPPIRQPQNFHLATCRARRQTNRCQIHAKINGARAEHAAVLGAIRLVKLDKNILTVVAHAVRDGHAVEHRHATICCFGGVEHFGRGLRFTSPGKIQGLRCTDQGTRGQIPEFKLEIGIDRAGAKIKGFFRIKDRQTIGQFADLQRAIQSADRGIFDGVGEPGCQVLVVDLETLVITVMLPAQQDRSIRQGKGRRGHRMAGIATADLHLCTDPGTVCAKDVERQLVRGGVGNFRLPGGKKPLAAQRDQCDVLDRHRNLLPKKRHKNVQKGVVARFDPGLGIEEFNHATLYAVISKCDQVRSQLQKIGFAEPIHALGKIVVRLVGQKSKAVSNSGSRSHVLPLCLNAF